MSCACRWMPPTRRRSSPCGARTSSPASCATCRSSPTLQRELGIAAPRVSLWLTGLQETVEQLPAFVRLADTMGVREVYLQRLVFDEAGYGMARAESSLFEQVREREAAAIEAAEQIARRAWYPPGCVGCHGTGAEPAAAGAVAAVVDLPAAVVADVFHRAWPCAALLHRAVLRARLRNLHAGRRDAADAAGDLERRGVSGFPQRAAERRTAEAVRELRAAVEFVRWQ